MITPMTLFRFSYNKKGGVLGIANIRPSQRRANTHGTTTGCSAVGATLLDATTWHLGTYGSPEIKREGSWGKDALRPTGAHPLDGHLNPRFPSYM